MSKFWTAGRQNGTYFKKLVMEVNRPTIKFDCYLLKYVGGSYIQPHVDPSSHGQHYRLNIVLRAPKIGGVFKCARTIFNVANRVILFRPDLYSHQLTPILSGTRIVLSIGWICNIRK